MDIRGNAIIQILTYLLPFISSPDRRHTASGLSLFIANLIPIVGVIFFGWLPGTILLMYWMESAVVGFYNVLKMLAASMFETSGKFNPVGILGGAFLSAFFTVHFGIFMLVHGIFLLVFMAMGFIPAPSEWGLGQENVSPMVIARIAEDFFLPRDLLSFLASPGFGVTAVFASHGISFVLHFVRGKEYITQQAGNLMMQPYRRIIVMHMTIILGAMVMFGAQKLGLAGAGIVAVMVVLKTIVDLRSHYKERTQMEAAQVTAA